MDSYKGPKGDSGPSDRKTRGVKASYNVRHTPGISARQGSPAMFAREERAMCTTRGVPRSRRAAAADVARGG